jgi:hypothetical protein
MEDYVYTLSAAYQRLRRNYRSVWVFMPNTGELVPFTKRNWKKNAKRFRELEQS